MSHQHPVTEVAQARKGSADLRRRIHEYGWDQQRKLFLPFHGPVDRRNMHGWDQEHRIPGIYDSTGVQAVDDAANFTKSMLFPPDFPWLRLKAKPPWDKDLAVMAVLDDMALMALRYISDSNFYLGGNQWIKQWFVFGNTTIHTDELPPRLRPDRTTFTALDFTTVPVMNSWWTMGRGNATLYQFRSDRMAAVDALYEFEATAEHGGKVIKDLMESKPAGEMEDFEVLHMVWRNDNKAKHKIDIGNAVWGSAWLAMVDGRMPTDVLRLETMDFNPYVNGRFDVPAGDTYGVGPAARVANKMKGLNNIEKNQVNATARDLNPTLAVASEEFIQIEQIGGGIATIRMEPGAPNPFFLESGTRPDRVEPIRDRMEQQVKMAFVGSVFDEPENEPRSAQRVVDRRANEVNRNSQPAEHVARELLTPMTTNTLNMLTTGGVFKRQLALLAKLTGGRTLEIEYGFESPYFTAQKDTVVQRLRAHIAYRVELFKLTGDPEWLIDINAQEVMKVDAELSAVPHRIFYSDDEVAARRGRNEAAEHAAEVRAALESAGKAAPAFALESNRVA